MSPLTSGATQVAAGRLLEDAADELARLDQLLSRLPGASTLATWLAAVAALSSEPGRLLGNLVAAAADPVHDASLPPELVVLRAFVSAEERRVRSGAQLSLARWIPLCPALATYPERARLEALWQEGTAGRATLLRALDSTALLDGVEGDAKSAQRLGLARERFGDLSGALILCGAGRMAHIRLLPFTPPDADERSAATRAWRDGDPDEWHRLGLQALARSARQLREAHQRLDDAGAAEEDALDSLGRAAITARRVVDLLRGSLAVTMPTVAESLGVSRPAATDALERLTIAGLAVEVTGRARDRVFAWAGALRAVTPASAA